MMRLCVIQGGYAEQCPPVKLNGDSVQQLVRGIEFTYPAFRRKFYETPWSITLKNPKQNVQTDLDGVMLAGQMELGTFSEVHFVPDINGGFWFAPLFIALAQAAAAAGAAVAGAVGSIGAALGAAGSAFAAGGSLALVTSAGGLTLLGQVVVAGAMFGLQQAFTPSIPQIQNQSVASGAAQHPSFLYNAQPNVSEQGNVIPLIYGRMRVGCTIISTGLTTTELTLTRGQFE